MPRTPRGPIDLLVGYTIIDPAGPPYSDDPPDPPEQDYFVSGNYTIWGVGLITFGPPTAAQQAWLANPANLSHPSNLSTFPTDWVSFGFPRDVSPISLWQGATMVADTVALTEQGISGAASWSIGGVVGAFPGTFFWSDVSVNNGTGVGETINGTNSAETLNGLGGDDTLNGGGGSDALHGGAGNDHLIGGDGVDRLWGEEGDDLLEPGPDSAFIYIAGGLSREGVYFVDGGTGFDTLALDFSTSSSQSISGDQLLASSHVLNVEAVKLTGSAFSDFLTGSSNADQLFGGGGFDYLSGGGGDDWLDAGAAGASSVGVLAEGGFTNADALSLDHLFVAGPGYPSVTFHIDQGEEMVHSWGVRPQAGNIYSFTVSAAGAQAFINYNAEGGFSDGANFEFYITDENGVPVDWYPYDPATPIVFPHAGTYYLQAIVFNQNPWDYASMDVTLSLQGADVLTSNVLEGGTGNDTYVVYAATDQVIENAGEGTDTVRTSVSLALPDNVENLTLTGAAAIDGTGNNLANAITGNSGANVIIGGGGADVLSGAAGADRFKFLALSDSAPGFEDLITDFSGRKGQGDKIDLSAIDANSNTAANDAFSLVNKFSGKAGQLVVDYDKQTGLTSISLDVNGDRLADMVIELSGQVKLAASDFIF